MRTFKAPNKQVNKNINITSAFQIDFLHSIISTSKLFKELYNRQLKKLPKSVEKPTVIQVVLEYLHQPKATKQYPGWAALEEGK